MGQECRLRVFENWVLRRIFGPKRNEVTGEWRKLHNEELNNLYSKNIIRAKNEKGGACSMYGERKVAYRILVRKPEGNRPLGRPRRRLMDNIKMNLQEVKWGAWTGLFWLRIGTGGVSCQRGKELSSSIICGEFLD